MTVHFLDTPIYKASLNVSSFIDLFIHDLNETFILVLTAFVFVKHFFLCFLVIRKSKNIESLNLFKFLPAFLLDIIGFS